MHLREKLDLISKELNAYFIQRDHVVERLVYALLSKNHVLLHGKHGIAKTGIIKAFMSHLDESFTQYRTQIMSDSGADNLFGPTNLHKLSSDNPSLERCIDRTMVDCDIAFCDEFLDCSDKTLRATIGVLGPDRVFYNGKSIKENEIKCPLISFFGSTNNNRVNDTIKAVLDRILFRIELQPIRKNNLPNLMNIEEEYVPNVTISKQELFDAFKEIKNVKLPSWIVETVIYIYNLVLNHKDQSKFIISERKILEVKKLLKAIYWFNNGTITFRDIKIACECFGQITEVSEVSTILTSKNLDKAILIEIFILENGKKVSQYLNYLDAINMCIGKLAIQIEKYFVSAFPDGYADEQVIKEDIDTQNKIINFTKSMLPTIGVIEEIARANNNDDTLRKITSIKNYSTTLEKLTPILNGLTTGTPVLYSRIKELITTLP